MLFLLSNFRSTGDRNVPVVFTITLTGTRGSEVVVVANMAKCQVMFCFFEEPFCTNFNPFDETACLC